MNIYVLTGLPGSGKTTWAKKKVKKEQKTIIINRDAFRTMIKGEYLFKMETEPLIKGFAEACVVEAIISKFDIILDETNIDKRKRKYWTDLCRNFPEPKDPIKIHCVHFTEKKNNLKYRIAGDARDISKEKWGEIINSMILGFENPGPDEDFDEFITVAI